MIEAILSLTMMTLTVGLPIGIVIVAHENARRAEARRAANLAAFGRALGLASSGDSMIYGRMHGVPVRMRHDVRGSGKHRTRYTVVDAIVDPPLDLGLSVTMQHVLFSALNQLVGAQDHRLGDPKLDATFVIRGDEPNRIAALLDPQLRANLLHLAQRFAVELRDDGIRLEIREHRIDGVATTMLDAVARMALHVADRRHRIPSAAAMVQHVFVWQRLAASLGFTFYPSPLAIVGELEGGLVSAYTTRVGPFQFVTRLSATFARPLPFQLSVRPTTTMAFDFFTERDDVRVGHVGFDDRFYVRSDRPELAKQVLEGEAAARVLRLAERGRVTIDAYGFGLTLLDLGAPGAIAPLLSDVRAAADVIYAASDAAPRRQGAYR